MTTRVDLQPKGEIIDTTPIGSKHTAGVGYLDRLLHNAVGDRAFAWRQRPVRLGTEPQPDLMRVKLRADFYAHGHPGPDDVLLILEVADMSLGYDRDVKIPLYAQHLSREVWLIDIASAQLATYRHPVGQSNAHPEPDSYREIIQTAPLSATPLFGLPELRIDLSNAF